MKYLVTGGCGFLGSNISAQVLNQGEELIILDNLYRLGSNRNLHWLKSQGDFQFTHADIRNYNDVEQIVKETKPEVIFHLAGQVAMTTSIANPRLDFEVNTLGTFNLLEAVRNFSPESAIIYSSTNKVYGDLEKVQYQEFEKRYICPEYPKGFDESLPLDFHSPYGCSKGSAEQYIQDYTRIFGLQAVVFRHSSIYGGRQFSNYDQGWIGWFCQKALERKLNSDVKPFTISGNGKQVRDVLYASDAVACYFQAVKKIKQIKGLVFNIGGGVENSLSLLELFSLLEELTETSLKWEQLSWRASDQKVFIANIEQAQQILQWQPQVSFREGVKKTLSWINNTVSKPTNDL